MRVDNGTPWGSSDDVPTPLALWLVGLGVVMHWNDPSCPQQNGVVERSMGTFKDWSEPRTCQSVEQWQERLDREERVYREEYPTEHMADYTLQRTVSGNGRLSLFNRSYYAGRALMGKVVQVYLNPQTVEWVVMDPCTAAQLRSFPADTLTRKNIVDLLKL